MFSELPTDILNIIVLFALSDYYNLLYVNRIIKEIVYGYIYSFDIDFEPYSPFSSPLALRGSEEKGEENKDKLYFSIKSKILKHNISNIKNINIYSRHIYLPHFTINISVQNTCISVYNYDLYSCNSFFMDYLINILEIYNTDNIIARNNKKISLKESINYYLLYLSNIIDVLKIYDNKICCTYNNKQVILTKITTGEREYNLYDEELINYMMAERKTESYEYDH